MVQRGAAATRIPEEYVGISWHGNVGLHAHAVLHRSVSYTARNTDTLMLLPVLSVHKSFRAKRHEQRRPVTHSCIRTRVESLPCSKRMFTERKVAILKAIRGLLLGTPLL